MNGYVVYEIDANNIKIGDFYFFEKFSQASEFASKLKYLPENFNSYGWNIVNCNSEKFKEEMIKHYEFISKKL